MFTTTENAKLFHFLCKKLHEGDYDFFRRMGEKNQGFAFEVVFTFDMKEAISTSSQLAFLPYLKQVNESDLSQDQISAARAMGRRNLNRDKPKLVSSLENEHYTTDFVENLLYLICFRGLKVLRIISCMSFTMYDYMSTYIQSLQIARKNSPSDIFGKICKSLG